MFKIPEVLHATWFGGPIPSRALENLETWRNTNPDWKIQIWNDHNMPLLSEPSRQLLQRDRTPVFVSDVVRLEVVHQFGGVYLDLDTVLQRSLSPVASVAAFVATVRLPDRSWSPANGVFGAVAGHLWLAELLRRLPDHHLAYSDRQVNESVGMTPFRQVAFDWMATPRLADEAITFYPPEYFLPHPWWDCPENATAPEAYALHQWWGSWADPASPP